MSEHMTKMELDATNHERRAQALRMKAKLHTATKMLKGHPHHAETVIELLASLGVTPETTPSAKSPYSRVAQGIIKRAETKQAKLDDKAKATTKDVDLSQYRTDELAPTKYWSLEELSVKLLCEKMLEGVDPIVFSRANARSMIVRGNSDCSKQQLVRIVEFATGESGEFGLVGTMRVWDEVLRHLKACARARASRWSRLIMPVDWNMVGLYRKQIRDGHLQIVHNYTHAALDFDIDVSNNSDLADVYVKYNWSETRCVVESKSKSFDPIRLIAHFPVQVADDKPQSSIPTMKRARPFALCDLSSGSTSPARALCNENPEGEGSEKRLKRGLSSSCETLACGDVDAEVQIGKSGDVSPEREARVSEVHTPARSPIAAADTPDSAKKSMSFDESMEAPPDA